MRPSRACATSCVFTGRIFRMCWCQARRRRDAGAKLVAHLRDRRSNLIESVGKQCSVVCGSRARPTPPARPGAPRAQRPITVERRCQGNPVRLPCRSHRPRATREHVRLRRRRSRDDSHVVSDTDSSSQRRLNLVDQRGGATRSSSHRARDARPLGVVVRFRHHVPECRVRDGIGDLQPILIFRERRRHTRRCPKVVGPDAIDDGRSRRSSRPVR